MKYYAKMKSYFTTHNKCFIPICKARCCVDAPLPEGFLPQFQSRIQRTVHSAVNIGQNDPRDTFNSIIYNTSLNPIQLVGFDSKGNRIMGIPKEVVKKLQLKSMEQIKELMEKYKDWPNYCPFITNRARCSVYEHRPPICREFGSSPLKINLCPKKSSRLDIIKHYIKNFFDVKGTYKFVKNSIKEKFAKN